ncbi:hypothetical protein CYMTET_48022 [Cymbomonas tetramitiformis]|uniref:Poly [ADP-ribose] polymerase n=1 Tax=Cymbomonas tetramitiformis TaxID=36881 RepID=A0AAE0EVJ8_9CHLO|nr:hypothetical protein CYMTET_48022 [Cymbomonas tetramitiformis]
MSREGDNLEDARIKVEEICTVSPVGADLMMSAFYIAIQSYRRPSVCTPFPSNIFWKADHCLGGNNRDKDFEKASNCMDSMPSVEEISVGALAHCPPETTRLALWLLDSKCVFTNVRHATYDDISRDLESTTSWPPERKDVCPSHILAVDRDETDSSLGFEGAKTAFHGTPGENLHSILRCGLLNLTGTRLQRNGNLFGAGIYLSTSLSVAYNFCSPAKRRWPKSQLGDASSYVFVCKVKDEEQQRSSDVPQCETQTRPAGDTQELESSQLPDTYLLVQRSDLVQIRYIFVYSNGGAPVQAGSGSNLPPKGARIDWCTLLIVGYVVLMAAIGLSQSNISKLLKTRF